jgi:hypothetical protein
MSAKQLNGKIIIILDGNPIGKHILIGKRVAVFRLVECLYADGYAFGNFEHGIQVYLESTKKKMEYKKCLRKKTICPH